MILFFDTETTGLFDFKAPIDADHQPHIVQIAAQLCADDGDVLAGFSLIVNPGVSIPDVVAAIHGITDERAATAGVKPLTALGLFGHLYDRATLLVAHNAKFDCALMNAARIRHRREIGLLAKPVFCTMNAAAPILNLPPTDRMRAAGFNKPKAPKLEECVRHFFGEELDGAHDAMIDVAACRRVYFHMKGLSS